MVNKDFVAFETIIDWNWLKVDPLERIHANCARVPDRLQGWEGETNSTPVAIVGYGPSLLDTWRDIKNYDTVITTSGAHNTLLSRKVTPTYHVETDPQAHKVKMLGKPSLDTIYLLSSIIHPNYIDALTGMDVRLFHICLRGTLDSLPKGEWVITCPGTVIHFAARIARFLGYTNLHFFGADHSMTKSGQRHAGIHTGNREGDCIDVDGYLTNRHWLSHIESFFVNLDTMPDVSYTIHGDGLLRHKDKNRVKQSYPYSPRGVMM